MRGLFDPLQSPIRLKAIKNVRVAEWRAPKQLGTERPFLILTAPGPIGPQKIVGAMPIPNELFQIIWLSASPFLVIDMGGAK